MGIHIKTNPTTKAGRQTLYLLTYKDYKPYREALDLFLFANPRNLTEREHNKVSKALAEKIRSLREIEDVNGFDGSKTRQMAGTSFIDYFEKAALKRQEVKSSYLTWLATINHLKVFLNGVDLKFKQCDDIFLERFKEYLLKCKGLNRTKNLSSNSANLYISKIKAVLNDAVRDRYIIDNPGKRLVNIKMRPVHVGHLTTDELTLLRNTECYNPILKRAFLFSCLSGLRWSDIKKLKWAEVSFSSTENMWKLIFKQQKTGEVTYIPIPEHALDLMGKVGGPNDLVFKGLHYNAHNNKLLLKWVHSAGIDKHITFHCARHTYAIILQANTNNLGLVSSMLGHKDIKTTMRYAKISNVSKNEAAKSLPVI